MYRFLKKRQDRRAVAPRGFGIIWTADFNAGKPCGPLTQYLEQVQAWRQMVQPKPHMSCH